VSDLSASQRPFAILVLEKIEGRDLRHELASMTDAQVTALAGHIAGFQRKVATLRPGKGFGYVGIGEIGPHRSWWEMVRPGPSRTDANGPVPEPLLRSLHRQIELAEPYLRAVPPTCFLDDITMKNVLIADGSLTGLIDFDYVCYGDPLYWLGLTTTGAICDIGASSLRYPDELARCLELMPGQRRIAMLYAAWIATDFVKRFHATETPEWNTRMLNAIGVWLLRLEGCDDEAVMTFAV